MQERRYTIVLVPDLEDGGYTVLVPALPGCITEGDTVEEAIAMAKEAIEGWIQVAKEQGEPIPESDPGSTVITTTVDVAA